MTSMLESQRRDLLNWYRKNFRPLPWRVTRDPYLIWISEIMLQQTTVTAVLPYYDRFVSAFPNVKALAKASESDVLSHWAGLGYYSRARNLHKAAKLLSKTDFPQDFEALLEFPGFGPYTARAVATFAFDQKVGVLDGNVIRFLSRFNNLAVEYWKPQGRQQLQHLADAWAQSPQAADINQGLIEIGATICLPQNPKCLLCPVMKSCLGHQKNRVHELPMKKPKRAPEIWIWEITVARKSGKVALTQNHDLPFLTGHWVWPGQAKKVRVKPKTFDLKHSVTHHNIYVKIKTNFKNSDESRACNWIPLHEIKNKAPSSIIKKTLEFLENS